MKLTDLIPPEYRILAAAGGATLAIAAAGSIVGGIYLHGRAAGVKAEAPKVAAAEGEAAGAKAQGGLDAAAAALPAEADHRTLDINLHAETAAHAIETAPGASTALPADVLRQWSAGIDGVRDEARAHAAASTAAGEGRHDATRAVPTAAPS